MRPLLKVLPFVRGAWGVLFVTIALSLLGQALSVIGPLIAGEMFKQAVLVGRLDELPRLAAAILGLYAFRGLLNWVEIYLGSMAGQRIVCNLRQRVYDHLLQLRFRFFDRTRTGELLARLTSDLEPVNGFIRWGARLSLKNAALLLFSFGLAMRIDFELAIMAMGVLPLIAITAYLIGARIRPAYDKARQQLGVTTSRLQDNLQGIRVVQTYVQEEREIAAFDAESDRLADLFYKADRIDATYYPLTGFWSGLAILLVVAFGGMRVIDGRLTLDQYVVVSLLVSQLVLPMRFLGYMLAMGQRAASSCARIFAILEDEEDAERLPELVTWEEDRARVPARQPCPSLTGAVRFENVSFGYDGPPHVVQEVDLAVRAGETIGIVGATGSGKSTLVSLIPAFHDPTEGRVLVEGLTTVENDAGESIQVRADFDVTKVEPTDLRRQVGFVFQDGFLFPGTIRENVLFGRPEASEQEMVAAAQGAAIHEFILTLPEGYDTLIGERGMTLSGGQQQRLTIARTILMDPRILILDDYTSNVDTYTEFLIQSALERLMEGRTTFIITPRAASLRRVDRVIVLERGRIVAQGAPGDLAERGDNLYSDLLKLEEQQRLLGAA